MVTVYVDRMVDGEPCRLWVYNWHFQLAGCYCKWPREEDIL